MNEVPGIDRTISLQIPGPTIVQMVRIHLKILTPIQWWHKFVEGCGLGHSYGGLVGPVHPILCGKFIEANMGWRLGQSQSPTFILGQELYVVGISVSSYVDIIVVLSAGLLLTTTFMGGGQSYLAGLTQVQGDMLPRELYIGVIVDEMETFHLAPVMLI